MWDITVSIKSYDINFNTQTYRFNYKFSVFDSSKEFHVSGE